MSGPMLLLGLALVAAPSTSADVMSVLEPTSGGLTIDDVIERAVKTSGVSKRAQVEYARAKSDYDSAYLLYFPRLDLTGAYGRQSPVDAPSFGMPGTDPGFSFEQPEETISGIIALSIPASDYALRIINQYDATEHAAAAARLNMEAQKDGVALNAVTAFIEAVRARAATVVTKASVDVLTEQLTDLEALAEAGLATPGDVLQLRAQLSFSKVQLARSEGALVVLEEQLRRALHDGTADLRHGENLLVDALAPLPQKDEAVGQALKTRAEVRALSSLSKFREELVAVERAGLFPRLTVDANVVHAKPNQRIFFDPNNFNTTWNLTFNLRWSPNDAVRSYSNWGKAEQEVMGVAADLLALEDAISVEVSDALTSYQSAQRLLGAAKDGLEAAEGAFEDRKSLVAAGQAPTTELVLAQQDLRNAQLQLINVHLDIRLARARLDRALGRLRKGDDR